MPSPRRSAARSTRCGRATPSSSFPATAAEAEARVRAARGDLRVMSAGRVIEIYKDVGLPEVVRRDVRAREPPREPRARPHADGDREPRHDRGLASVLDRARPLPRPQRVALEPQHAAPGAAARGDRVPDRERHRGRGRVPRLAAARGRLARGRRSRGASTTSTASTPSRSARPTASPCCATRSPASRRCSPRPTTGSRWRPSTTRSPCSPVPTTRGCGSPSRAVVYVWDKAAVA